MPDVRAQLIISAKDEASQTLKTVGQSGQETAEGFKINTAMIAAGVAAVGAVMKDAIGVTESWAQTIDKLSRASGENATQTSQMAVIFEDFGVKADSLDRTIRAMTSQGLQFNLATIKELAVQYQAIQDPVARNEFAFKNFGRSALEMTEILSKTPAQLDAIGAAAMSSGKILNDQMVNSLQASSVKFQQFQDKVDGLKIALGVPLIGVLGRAIDGFYNLEKVVQSVDIAIMAHTGIISWDEATAREAAVAQGDLTAAYKTAQPVIQAQTAAITNANFVWPSFIANMSAANLKLLQHTEDSKSAQAADNALAVSLGNASRAAAEQAKQLAVNISMTGELTKQEIFQTASVGLNSDEQLALARSLGLVDEQTLKQIRSINSLKDAHDKGVISTDQFIAGVDGVANSTAAAANSVNNLAEQIAALHDKTITVTVNQNYGGQYGNGGPGYTGGGGTSTTGGGSTNPYNGIPGYASGGDFVVPPGYGNDNFLARFTSGEHVSVSKSGGGDSAVTALMTGLPYMIGRAVRDAMQLARV